MSRKRQKFPQGTYIKFLNGETYEVIRDNGIFVKTRNLKTGHLRTFTSIEIGYLKS